MAQMISRLALGACLLVATGLAAAAPDVPPAAMKAEMEQRWDDALVEYRKAVRQDPKRGDLWLRMADIYAVRGDPEAAARAVAEAAALKPKDAALQARLSQAWAVADEPRKALEAIQRAVALEPANPDYLRSQAELASWAGDAELAEATLRKLGTGDALKGLARMQTRAGDLDAAVATWERYHTAYPDDASALLDWAETEMYRGNYASARKLLDRYRAANGETEAYRRAEASLLARAGRPSTALSEVDELLRDHPDDYELRMTRTLALNARRQQSDALEQLSVLEELGPQRPETRGMSLQVNTPLRPRFGGGGEYYSDHLGIVSTRAYLEGVLTEVEGARVSLAVNDRQLKADPGSGFEADPAVPDLDAGVVDIVANIRVQILRDLAFDIGGGFARYDDSTVTSLYRAGLDFWTGDLLHWTASSRRAPLAVSPRALAMNLHRDEHRVTLEWQPTYSIAVDLRGALYDYSDGNNATEGEFAPRYAVARTARHNLDLGVYGQWLSYDANMGNGYYDPLNFERYWAMAYYYWKGGENYGIGTVLGVGPERDRALDSGFKTGGNLYVGGTFGIYRDWQLRVQGGYGGRLDSAGYTTGTPEAWSAGVELMRRF